MSLTYPVTYCRIFSAPVSPSINLLPFHAPSSLPFPLLAEESSARRRWDYHRLDNAPPMETVLRFLSSGRIRFEKIKRGTCLFPFLFVSFSILFRGRRRRKGSGMDERLLRRGIIRSLFLFRFYKDGVFCRRLYS